MRIRILPYRQGSKSAKSLADALGGRVLKLEGSKYKFKTGDFLINWGNTKMAAAGAFLNCSAAIVQASNKLLFFRLMKEKQPGLTPEFWETPDEIPEDAFPVVCRTTLAGHSGDGIVMADKPDDLVPASLYTRYVKKEHEYRVHVGVNPYQGGPCKINCSGGCFDCAPDEHPSIIAVQRKARKLDVPDEEVDWRVRNHKNGFVFVRQDVKAPEAVLQAAKDALFHTGLDFGAVDVVWNTKKEQALVLEINTAPGLEGQTILDYANYFKELTNV